jgi:DNA polymerase-1
MPKLVLIDGYSQAFRAFYGLPPNFTTSSGELTNAVYGFASMLLNVIAEEKPEFIAVAFDVGRTFRHDQFSDYKSTRAKMPEEMRVQLPRIRELIEALNIPIFEIEGYEADDLIGSLAQQASAQNVDSVLVSGDRDLFQLIALRVRVRYTAGGPRPKTMLYDAEAVAARFGVQPAQLPDFKALTGDTSDNIPGVPGVGDKTAATLINTYGTIENLLDRSGELKPARVQAAVTAHSEQIKLNKQLATIVTNLPVSLDLERCRTRDYDRARVLALFRELEFKSLVERLPAVESGPTESVAPASSTGVRYRLAATEADLAEVVDLCQAAPLIAIDVETTSTDPMQARLVGVALAWGAGEAAYVPVHVVADETSKPAAPLGLGGLPLFAELPANAGKPTIQPGLPLAVVQRMLGPLLASSTPPKAAHNASYDLTVLHEAGLPVNGLQFDTFLGEWLCNPGSHSLGLKAAAFTRLGVQMTEITELIGKGKAQITMDQVPVAQVTDYAAADVDMTLQIQPLIEAELAQKNQTRLFHDVEMPLVPVLVAIERAGVLLDLPFLKEMEKTLLVRLAALETEIHALAGYPFNINSTQQLADVLFGKLAIPSQGLPRTGTGKISLAAGVLEGMSGRHPIIDLILEQRQLGKLQSTYVQALPNLMNPRTGRVHTSFNQAGSETGRISSSNPNLQNIPIRTEIGRQVRRAFIAPPGWQLVSADYSQVELRIVAHASRDENLVGAFERGEDVHASTAAAVYGVPLAEVTKEQRARAKTVNFGLVYGQSAFGLAQQTGMSQAEASEFISRYFAIYPQVKSYLDGLRRQAAEQGYVETLLGRRRYFPELAAGAQTPYNVRQALERAAINAPIQGSSADIIKIAMIRLAAQLHEQGLRARMIMQVHDELVLEAPAGEVDVVVPLVREVMSGAYTLSIPLLVEVEVGQNWLDMDIY